MSSSSDRTPARSGTLDRLRRALPAVRSAAGGLLRRPPSAAVRSSSKVERGPGISFRYSFHAVEADEQGARFVAREARFEQGKLQTEALEGCIDREHYQQALTELRGEVTRRVAALMAPITRLLEVEGDGEDGEREP